MRPCPILAVVLGALALSACSKSPVEAPDSYIEVQLATRGPSGAEGGGVSRCCVPSRCPSQARVVRAMRWQSWMVCVSTSVGAGPPVFPTTPTASAWMASNGASRTALSLKAVRRPSRLWGLPRPFCWVRSSSPFPQHPGRDIMKRRPREPKSWFGAVGLRSHPRGPMSR